MKKLFVLLLFFCFQLSFSQQFKMIVEGSNAAETKIIDSIGFIKKHINVASIVKEQKSLEQKLQYKGYFQNELLLQTKLNDSIFFFKYSLKNKVQLIHIYIGTNSEEEKQLLNLENDSIKLSIEEVETFMQNKISLLEKKGYSLAKLKLTDYNQVDNYLQ
ncbi:MAG: hypothetical protein ACI9FW_000273, partial [Flavobacterium sp.]